jgi:Tol biopolymer transport system component
MPLAPGTRLGPYEILAPLGAGGMGEVYKARDTRLDRTVAVKILPAHLSAEPTLRQRFEREARAVSSLNHPHICTLHDVGQQDGTDYLVMEYLEGDTLAKRLEKGPLPLDQVLKFATQIADALDKAHRQGVVHRDMKPGNVMLTAAGAKLLDFGLAKSTAPIAPGSSLTMAPTQASPSSPVTQHGTIVGTFQYMSPEQVEGREVDARTDIFAFGAVLYEMLTGRRAFLGKSSLSVASAILEKEPEPIAAIAPMTPPALDRTIRKCLAKDPEDRWQTARDLLLELRWIAEAGSQAGVPAVVSTRRRITERAWMAAAAVLLLLAAALGVLYYRSVSQEPQVVRAFIPPPEKAIFDAAGGPSAGPVAISPDGRLLVFALTVESSSRLLWVRPIDSLTARPLTGTDNGAFPFWSPDSRIIGFFAGGKLKKIDVAGGPPITLCDAISGRGGTWSRDGVIVFSPDSGTPLHQVSAGGGAPTPVTKLDAARGESTHRWPHFLPDGRHFLFLSRIGPGGGSSEGSGVMVGSLDGTTPKLLLLGQTKATYASGYLLFVREDTLMAQPFDPSRREFSGDAFPIAEGVQTDTAFSRGVFSVSDNGVLVYQSGQTITGTRLLWFDRAGKQLGQLGDQAIYIDLSISPDGRRVAVNVLDPRVGPPDIWIYEVSRGLRTRFTFAGGVESNPVWSPDAARIGFRASVKTIPDLYEKSLAGTGQEQPLLETELAKFPYSWSPDGRFLAFETRGVPGTTRDIWVLPLQGERKPFVFLQTRFLEGQPQFSPDGKWLVYVSDESGRDEVYVSPFPVPSRKWQISSNGGDRPRWRRNGKEIYYLTPDNKIAAVEVGARGDSFEVGPAKTLFETRAMRGGSAFDVTSDGQRFLVNSLVQAQSASPLVLVTNWTAGVKK